MIYVYKMVVFGQLGSGHIQWNFALFIYNLLCKVLVHTVEWMRAVIIIIIIYYFASCLNYHTLGDLPNSVVSQWVGHPADPKYIINIYTLVMASRNKWFSSSSSTLPIFSGLESLYFLSSSWYELWSGLWRAVVNFILQWPCEIASNYNQSSFDFLHDGPLEQRKSLRPMNQTQWMTQSTASINEC